MSDHFPPDEPVQPVPASLPPAPGGEAEPAVAPAEPTKRKRGAVIALVVAIVLVVACSGGALAYFKMRGAASTVLDKLPAGADVAFVAHLDPAAGQKANLFRLTEKFPDLGSREELGRRFDEMVDEALGDAGLSHDDLDWIGGEAGGYADVGVGTPTYGLVIATDDEAAAKEALRRVQTESSSAGASTTSTISGIDVSVASDGSTAAVFDGVAVLASDENAMRSVIDTANGASSIEDDAIFQGVLDRLPEDNLGFVFVNVHELVSLLNAMPAELFPSMPSTDQLAPLEGVGISVSAEPDGLAIDTVATTDPSKLTDEQREALAAADEPNDLLDLTPANAFAVFAASGVDSSGLGVDSPQGIGDAIHQIARLDPSAARTIARLHLEQLLTHLTGDTAIQVGPGTGLLPVGGTVMVGIDDRDAVSAWFDRYLPMLLQEAEASAGTKIELRSQDHDGVTITSFEATPPAEVSWAVLDEAVVVGVTPADVAAAIDLSHGDGDAITSDQGFTSATAQVPGTGNVGYVDVQAVLSAVKRFVPPDAYQSFLDAGGRDVEPIDVIVAGGDTDENGSTARILIRVP
jgi:hypothetical protein